MYPGPRAVEGTCLNLAGRAHFPSTPERGAQHQDYSRGTTEPPDRSQRPGPLPAIR